MTDIDSSKIMSNIHELAKNGMTIELKDAIAKDSSLLEQKDSVSAANISSIRIATLECTYC